MTIKWLESGYKITRKWQKQRCLDLSIELLLRYFLKVAPKMRICWQGSLLKSSQEVNLGLEKTPFCPWLEERHSFLHWLDKNKEKVRIGRRRGKAELNRNNFCAFKVSPGGGRERMLRESFEYLPHNTALLNLRLPPVVELIPKVKSCPVNMMRKCSMIVKYLLF